MNHNAFCLAYVFTYRDFNGGTLGLAWVASPQGSLLFFLFLKFLNPQMTDDLVPIPNLLENDIIYVLW